MGVLGCLVPLLLLVLGGAVGVVIGGNTGGLWGAGAGFVLGCAVLVILLWEFERLIHR